MSALTLDAPAGHSLSWGPGAGGRVGRPGGGSGQCPLFQGFENRRGSPWSLRGEFSHQQVCTFHISFSFFIIIIITHVTSIFKSRSPLKSYMLSPETVPLKSGAPWSHGAGREKGHLHEWGPGTAPSHQSRGLWEHQF